MTLFLIAFLSLYGGMHAYAFVRLRGTFAPGQPTTAILAAPATTLPTNRDLPPR